MGLSNRHWLEYHSGRRWLCPLVNHMSTTYFLIHVYQCMFFAKIKNKKKLSTKFDVKNIKKSSFFFQFVFRPILDNILSGF